MSALPQAPMFRAGPAEPACLYDGHVMHKRLRPLIHRFRYRVFSLLIDLDRLEEASRLSPVFSVNRSNLVSFHENDHGRGDGTALAVQARLLAHEAGVIGEVTRVTLLCYPRILGYVFNPLSVYYLHDRSGALACVLYEVHNTFSQRHIYVAPVRSGELDATGLRQARDKLLYVSPFIDMAMRYEFYLKPPGDTVFLRIRERDRDGPLLVASFAGAKRALSTRRLLASCLAIPALTFKVVAAIHWEALKLWLKGARLVPRPAPPAATSLDGQGAFSVVSGHGSDAGSEARKAPLDPGATLGNSLTPS
ncbi:hypothetical protein SAMN05444161_4072 [Rhizobiales bacterium GAS191]|jgi:DUF1365 family protein|nr:hypothetical protein SAMN05519103_03367 [Rhizobiales bacterium GAS113]SED80927.1 hypothetical protein SAMN05444161_4072 [Rhizobiales bacterium GAS191]SEE64081.1 hypothetical protein SAMN05519104_6846 [Rhizobiales bacterium GAS188]